MCARLNLARNTRYSFTSTLLAIESFGIFVLFYHNCRLFATEIVVCIVNGRCEKNKLNVCTKLHIHIDKPNVYYRLWLQYVGNKERCEINWIKRREKTEFISFWPSLPCFASETSRSSRRVHDSLLRSWQAVYCIFAFVWIGKRCTEHVARAFWLFGINRNSRMQICDRL